MFVNIPAKVATLAGGVVVGLARPHASSPTMDSRSPKAIAMPCGCRVTAVLNHSFCTNGENLMQAS